MRRVNHRSLLVAGLLTPFLAIGQTGVDPGKEGARVESRIYSPYVERTGNDDFSGGVYWGDTHLHTNYSSDSGMIGNRLSPEEAYRFAKGEEVRTTSGQRARLIRPLDFLVVSDHAEALGLAPYISEANPDLLATENGKRWYDMVNAGDGYEAFREWGGYLFEGDPIKSPAMSRSVWDRQIAAAEKHNDPGTFTALIGFEWTSLNTAEAPSNLHRVVIFRDNGNRAGEVIPFTAYDSMDPEDLWAWMAGYEEKTGGRILAIPHNGNLSNGIMFSTERLNGRKIDRDYAVARMKWEPLYEVTQIKGDGEAHPFLSPEDEFADYGTWDKADIAGVQLKQDEMLQFEYARTALQVGLQQQQKLGVNPFKFGMIGSTDAHTGMAATRDENYWGKLPTAEPSPDRYEHYVIKSLAGEGDDFSTFEYETLASGLAGVWARDNTREALFNAMVRKETYATTGTRMVVRFFGGWDYEEQDAFHSRAAEFGYHKGVPMGGDLRARPDGKEAPRFIVGAMKDPWSGNLDRIQIIKGWVDKKGERHERIYDVAVSDGRTIDADGRCRTPVGSTVNTAEATFLNTVGDAELRALWTDPDFDPENPAVYYVRVLEIPTPTWQAYDMAFFGHQMSVEVPLEHQERAYTSPIWYTP